MLKYKKLFRKCVRVCVCVQTQSALVLKLALTLYSTVVGERVTERKKPLTSNAP